LAVLEDKTELGAPQCSSLSVCHRVNSPVPVPNLTRIRVANPSESMQQRRFPRAAATHHRDYLSGTDLDVHAIDGSSWAVAHRQAIGT